MAEEDFVLANALRSPTFKVCKFGDECKHWLAFQRYARKCRAHMRLCAGGWRFDDQCHCAIYSHGRPGRADWEGAVAMSGEDEAWVNVKKASTAGGVVMLRPDYRDEAHMLQEQGVALVSAELESHGLGFEMEMLETIVPGKKRHPRLAEAHAACPDVVAGGENSEFQKSEDLHWLKAQPVLDVEILAGLLYTGTDVQGQVRRALREPASKLEDIEGWKWTLTALRHLVIKLAEKPPDRLYHGLNNVRPPPPEALYHLPGCYQWTSYNNVISGSMSLDMAIVFAKGEGGTVAHPSKFGTVFHMDMTRDWSHTCAICADMRWISKFADEQEWVMIPAGTHSGLRLDRTRSEPLQTGGELFHQECRWG